MVVVRRVSAEFIEARLLSPPSQEDLRKRAVAAVNSGRSQKEIADTRGVSQQSVSHWMKAYHQGGLQALASAPRGRKTGEKRALTP
jgi:transposase